MTLKKIFFLFLLLIIQPGYGQQKDYSWPLPEKWIEELIPFPLKFAPGLDYPGIEVVHFMPGWRGNDTLPDQRWSYTFIWYLDSVINFTADKLGRDLTTYFDGLQRWVLKNTNGLIPGNIKSEIKIKRSGNMDPGKFQGTAKIHDVFFTSEPIRLNIKINYSVNILAGKTIILFELSPMPFRHPVWRELDQHISEFKIKTVSDQ